MNADKLAQAIERTARHRAATDGIDPDQWRVVLYKWEAGALAESELAAVEKRIAEAPSAVVARRPDAGRHPSCNDGFTAAIHRVRRRLDRQARSPAPAGRRGEVMNWQPIESAPKLRKVLAGYRNSHGHWRNVTAIYYPDSTLPTEDVTDDGDDEFAPAGWYETSETHDFIRPTPFPPSHWMPLPPPPSVEDDERE